MKRRSIYFIFFSLLIFTKASFAQIKITEAEYEGAPHFVIRTKSATYWYDKAGGGFSRLIDRDGKDWISFKREPWNRVPDSAASAFRGIPNFVFGSEEGGAGHPGFTKCESALIGKNQIATMSKSRKWKWTWTFSDSVAHVTMEKADPAGYWFLYEGTPGGSFTPNSWYWGNDAKGARLPLPDFLKGERDITQMRWAYFGDDKINRVLFIAHHEHDDVPDMFGVMGATKAGIAAPDGMTVFGFGRARESKTLMTAAPQNFTLGFYEQKITNEQQHTIFARYMIRLLPAKMMLATQPAFQEPTTKARLGEMHYSSLIGGTVGARGKKFTCELIGAKDRVLTLQVALSKEKSRIIKALRFETMSERGARNVKICGNETNADWQPVFAIPEGRQLVGISGASGWYVDNLRFHFDDGSTTPLYGGTGGDTEFRVLLNKSDGQWKGHLRGFWGLSATAIEALGLIFWPIE